jgi:FAD:protein FMN transferase
MLRSTLNKRLAARGLAAGGLAAVLLASACAESPRLVEHRIYAMGTWVDIAVVATPTAAEAALADAEALLRGFEIDYYAWADGQLAALNEALAGGREAVVREEMATLLADAKRLTLASEGAFDPAVGTLVELWGFHSALEEPRAPDAAAIDAWLRTGASLAAVEIDGRRVRGAVPGIKLDLGGIAKGEAVDRLVTLLGRHGIRNAMVNAGGDLRVLGHRTGRPWRIGIQDPRSDAVLGVIELADGEAAFTSGDYERYFEGADGRLHHIIDPRTGYPASSTRAVTVVAKLGVEADAAATALFVAGDDWRRLATAVGVDTVLRVDAAGEIEVTEEMNRRVEPVAAEQWDVVAAS